MIWQVRILWRPETDIQVIDSDGRLDKPAARMLQQFQLPYPLPLQYCAQEALPEFELAHLPTPVGGDSIGHRMALSLAETVKDTVEDQGKRLAVTFNSLPPIAQAIRDSRER